MRGWAIGLLVVVLGVGVWMLEPWADDTPELGDPGEAEAEAKVPEGEADPLSSSIERTQANPERDISETGKPFTVLVELVAYVVDRRGVEEKRLDGFQFRLSDGYGTEITRADAVDSGHKLRLGVGSYVLHVAMGKKIAPAPARFTITAESEPVALRFPFSDAEAVLSLEVLDVTTKSRIENYRVTVVTHVPGESQPKIRFVPRAESNPLPITSARGHKLVVKVEAMGFDPAEPLIVSFDGTADKIKRQVFLTPSMKFAGVEFHVTNEAGQAIPHLAVLTEQKSENSFEELWRRRKSDPKGVYKLPGLAPGVYRTELQSVDGEGIPTMYLAWRFEFHLTGNEHIREPVVLKPGGMIELRLTDSGGNSIGRNVAIELTHPDGKVRESVWRPIVDGKADPKAILSADHLGRDGHARLDRSLPPGLYKITLRWEDGPAVVVHMTLHARDVYVLNRQLSK
jgi:hypothetical protein